MPLDSNPPLDPRVATAIGLFLARVRREYLVSAAYLFGSRARGSFRENSDADVAVLLRGAHADFLATKLAMADIAYDVLLETGIRVQPLPIWEDEWEHPQAYSNPQLLTNIGRDGVRL